MIANLRRLLQNPDGCTSVDSASAAQLYRKRGCVTALGSIKKPLNASKAEVVVTQWTQLFIRFNSIVRFDGQHGMEWFKVSRVSHIYRLVDAARSITAVQRRNKYHAAPHPNKSEPHRLNIDKPQS